MTVTATHAPGTFCWLDLAAQDADAAKRFYSALFGWTANDMPAGPGPDDIYTMYQLDGKDVAASAAMQPEQKEAGVPSYWLLYVSVENVDQAAARAGELGGTVMAPPFDVLDVGRMALVQDPTGAMLALWQPGRHVGVGLRDVPGTLCWSELGTTDAARARDFYTGLFGWGTQEMGMPGMENGIPYTMFTLDDGETMVGGMYQLTPEMPGMPPAWTPYFAVDDADAAGERAKELGAEVLMGPDDIPNIGRFVLLRDPQGGIFYVIRLQYPDQS